MSKIINEAMRIGGKKVSTDSVVNVHYPYTNEIIGTVPAGRAEHAREAFKIAANYKPKLTRYERQKILFRTAELINARKDSLAPLITSELGISLKDSLYECGRAYDVFTLAGQLAILDDGQIFSCDLTPHGKSRKFTRSANLYARFRRLHRSTIRSIWCRINWPPQLRPIIASCASRPS